MTGGRFIVHIFFLWLTTRLLDALDLSGLLEELRDPRLLKFASARQVMAASDMAESMTRAQADLRETCRRVGSYFYVGDEISEESDRAKAE